MSDGARNFNAEQACYAKQKPEEARHEGTPNENAHIPLGTSTQLQYPSRFPKKQHKWSNEDRGASICPIGELDRRVVAVRKRGLDQDRVNSNGQGGEYAVE